MRRLLLCFLLLLSALPAAAQDTSAKGCGRLDFAGLFAEASTLLEADESSDDPALLDSMLSHILTTIQARRAECAGYVFEGSGGEVVGPLALPGGDYIVEVTLDTVGTVTAATLDQDCERALLGFLLASFDMSGGSDSNVLRTPSDCRILFDIGATGPWSFSLTPVS